MEYSIKNPPALLDYQDEIVFELPEGNLKYQVHYGYLHCYGHMNNRIFQALGIEEHAFLYKAYQPRPGYWLEYRQQDYAAATRAVWKIFGEIQKKYPKPFLDLNEIIDPMTVAEPIQKILSLDHWLPIESDIKKIAAKISGYDIEHLLVVR